MKKLALMLCLLCSVSQLVAQSKKLSPTKQSVVQSVDRNKDDYTKMSDAIWAYAETALKEYKSSKLLADYAEEKGFRVKRGVAGMPTAFTAEFGSGKPVIGIYLYIFSIFF
jgi:aminobenzoyl-glutamate utilization protein B